MEAIREAYARSQARRSGAGMGAVSEALGAIREPGEDWEESNAAGRELPAVNSASRRESTTEKTASTEPVRDSAQQPAPAAPALGIPWDDLEQELANGANP